MSESSINSPPSSGRNSINFNPGNRLIRSPRRYLNNRTKYVSWNTFDVKIGDLYHLWQVSYGMVNKAFLKEPKPSSKYQQYSSVEYEITRMEF